MKHNNIEFTNYCCFCQTAVDKSFCQGRNMRLLSLCLNYNCKTTRTICKTIRKAHCSLQYIGNIDIASIINQTSKHSLSNTNRSIWTASKIRRYPQFHQVIFGFKMFHFLKKILDFLTIVKKWQKNATFK